MYRIESKRIVFFLGESPSPIFTTNVLLNYINSNTESTLQKSNTVTGGSWKGKKSRARHSAGNMGYMSVQRRHNVSNYLLFKVMCFVATVPVPVMCVSKPKTLRNEKEGGKRKRGKG